MIRAVYKVVVVQDLSS